MDLDALNKRIDELVEELGKYKPDDPKRKPIVDEITALSKAANDAEKRELSRLNANRLYDIKDDENRVELERIQADRANSKRDFWSRVGTTVLSLLGSFGLAAISFKGEWISDMLKDRTVWDLAKSIRPKN